MIAVTSFRQFFHAPIFLWTKGATSKTQVYVCPQCRTSWSAISFVFLCGSSSAKVLMALLTTPGFLLLFKGFDALKSSLIVSKGFAVCSSYQVLEDACLFQAAVFGTCSARPGCQYLCQFLFWLDNKLLSYFFQPKRCDHKSFANDPKLYSWLRLDRRMLAIEQ